MTDTTGSSDPAALSPAPGPAPLPRMLAAQTAMELRLLLRNGEQLLLILVIPVLLLTLFTTADLLGPKASSVSFLLPGIIALAIMSTAFTGQAINTGFQRRYGMLKRLGATPLPRWALLAAKTATVLLIELAQVAILVAVALALGWRPHGFPPSALALVILGTATFSGLGLLLAGTLRAEATLAAANLIYVLFLVVGGVIFPLDRFPAGISTALELLPISALTGGLRSTLAAGGAAPGLAFVVLTVWTVAALAAASATFSWE